MSHVKYETFPYHLTVKCPSRTQFGYIIVIWKQIAPMEIPGMTAEQRSKTEEESCECATDSYSLDARHMEWV